MVQRGGNGEFQQMLENYQPSVLKSLVEDQLEEENGPLNKKTKIQLNKDLEMVPPQSIQDSLLEKPSPLGLCLRKTPSLLNLIQSTLSQKNSVSSSYATCNFGFEGGKKKGSRSTAVCGTNGNLKASNIPASILRIGSWEYESRYEGDLVGKFYYAQHKIVWEVLVGSAKSKIEVQWSNIAALKAIFDDYAPGTLEIVLAQQPLFFRESNPQPKKHTLWQATSDFTEGQASIHRRHFIQCPSGLLNRHFEKLIQCDPRLNLLSQQTEIKLDSPYFDIRNSFFEDRDRYNRHHGFSYSKGGFGTNFQGFLDHVLATTPQSTSSNNEVRVPIVRAPDNLPEKVISSSSAMDNYCTKNKSASSENKELNNLKPCDQIRTPVLSSSMSTSQLVNHFPFENDSSLDEMAQKLLSDFQLNSNLDEQSLMKRVNSFFSLIQQNESIVNDDDEKNGIYASHDDKGENGEKQQSISRRNSYDELLMNLPRIESVPQLFNIYEDCQIQNKFMI